MKTVKDILIGVQKGNPNKLSIKQALKKLNTLIPKKECSIWNTFKLSEIRKWKGLETCAECSLNISCESRIRNKTLDEVHKIYGGGNERPKYSI